MLFLGSGCDELQPDSEDCNAASHIRHGSNLRQHLHVVVSFEYTVDVSTVA